MSSEIHSTDSDDEVLTPRILVIDDDPDLVDALRNYFELFGWIILSASTGQEGLETMERERDLDLILLDVNLPDFNGFEVLERSQKAGIVAPVIMLSISAQDENRLRALGLGAKDYLTKPFDPDALKERIETIIGIAGHKPLPQNEPYQIGDAYVDMEHGTITRENDTITLTEKERELLRVLLEHRGQAVSRKRLLKEGLGVDQSEISFTMTLRVLYDALDHHIEIIRERIEPDPEHPVYLERVFGQGYRLRV